MKLISNRPLKVAGVIGLWLTATSCEEKAPVDPVQEAQQTTTTEEKTSEVPETAPLVSNEAFEAKTIYFPFDSQELSQEGQSALVALAGHLKTTQGSVKVEGHCDERGTTNYNLGLGERRANAVKNYLVQLGVQESKISVISYGEEKPADEGKTEEAYAKNRRAEFVL